MFLCDMNASKAIRFKERYNLNITALATNVFNHSFFVVNNTDNDYSSQTNVTSGASAPSITFTQNATGFAHLSAEASRVLLVGAQLTF